MQHTTLVYICTLENSFEENQKCYNAQRIYRNGYASSYILLFQDFRYKDQLFTIHLWYTETLQIYSSIQWVESCRSVLTGGAFLWFEIPSHSENLLVPGKGTYVSAGSKYLWALGKSI